MLCCLVQGLCETSPDTPPRPWNMLSGPHPAGVHSKACTCLRVDLPRKRLCLLHAHRRDGLLGCQLRSGLRTPSLHAAPQAYLAGLTFALAASPCSTPVLATLLAYVGASADPVPGGLLLLTYTSGREPTHGDARLAWCWWRDCAGVGSVAVLCLWALWPTLRWAACCC